MCLDIGKDNALNSRPKAKNLARIVVCLGDNVGHVRAAWDVIVVTEDVDGILAGNCRSVIDICRAISIVLAVDLGL